ncbi:MAG: hypothetical protein MUE35_04330 [Hydrogenophaga sp.]|jgi:hypothetical protein|nr:hypothetical protein [Hydrogenophaga sp.]
MDEQDVFFTQAVVGAPFSVLLGRQLTAGALKSQGIELDPAQGVARLSPAWQPWVIQRMAELPPGVPRRRPKALRRWLERHALGIAMLGLLALVTGALLAAHAQGWIEPWLKGLPW